MYALLRNLVSPAKQGEKSFDKLVFVLKNHYNPTLSEMVQDSRFNSRCRMPGESFAQFVAELRAMAEFCNYRETLEKMIRDRVVCGIMNSKIQQKLLAEKPETLKIESGKDSSRYGDCSEKCKRVGAKGRIINDDHRVCKSSDASHTREGH